MQPTQEEWNTFYNEFAQKYINQSAGVTKALGDQLLSLLPPITSTSIIHDNACGPGIITSSILAHCTRASVDPPTIYATDFAQGMIDTLQTTIDTHNLKTVTAQIMDGSDLSPFSDSKFTHSITNFGIFAFPDAIAATKHIHRTLKPGGVAAISTWKYPGNQPFVNQVLQELAPGIEEWSMKKEWTDKARLRNALEEGGFAEENIEIFERAMLWSIDDFEKTVERFNGSFWDQAKGGLTDSQKEGWEDAVRKVLKGRNGRGIDMIAWVGVARK
ncbi:Methyltransferase type 11 [Venturia nashicola]|uniref:Methyltransferase type 11 n=1 Tax=Venturia nashicola TaxID=86259 RepID=A0A4Z1P022_9PEZI|nr:Methyltransferase type 11 [Venturia nashicola]TLD34815.1 Methyltransferase type 11 [Venturia nashicola]